MMINSTSFSSGASVFTNGLAPDWRRYSFDWQAGRPAAIILAHGVPPQGLAPICDSFARHAASFIEHKADVLLLAAAEQEAELRASLAVPPSIEIIRCDEAFMVDSGAHSGRAMVVVVDRNLRVALRLDPASNLDVAACCLTCVSRFPRELPAPVLILPNLLPEDTCDNLIRRFESGTSNEGKVAGIDAAGQPRCYIDHTIKKRRDLQIPPNDPLYPLLKEALLTCCAPEIEKAFGAKITYADRLLLVRYDSPAGWFRRHRDNATENVAFREFALSVNLNAGNYDGGYLVFPEYNDQPHHAPNGGGVIFSASLLHEVAPVCSGRRYALLTFFHGTEGEKLRQDYEARFVGSRPRAPGCVPIEPANLRSKL
jgi:predicted 2-oxoglutarate/Fe(II)-dependent dioxygenase YbiX